MTPLGGSGGNQEMIMVVVERTPTSTSRGAVGTGGREGSSLSLCGRNKTTVIAVVSQVGGHEQSTK